MCDSGPTADIGVLMGNCVVFKVDPAMIGCTWVAVSAFNCGATASERLPQRHQPVS